MHPTASPDVPLPSDLLPTVVFNAQPGASLLLSPEWVIMGASDDYLAATLTERAAIVGQYIFDVFPENPLTSEANGEANVRASLAQVLATKQPHEMAPQHYDVPDRSQPGRFVERHWLLRHTPVLDAAGQVQFIIQTVQDITATRVAERQLRESQASEQDARADAEGQRQRFFDVLQHVPAQVAVYQGPDLVYSFVNSRYQSYFPTRRLLGRSIREALPEIGAQGFFDLLDQVYHTGQPLQRQEVEIHADLTGSGQLEQVFNNVLFHPLRDADGRVTSVLDFTYDVTEQVRARRQVEQLNQELEARVQQRTQEAEWARQRLDQAFRQAPFYLNMYRGPDHIFELVHPLTQALFGDRVLLGRPRREALPELGEETHQLFDLAYATGQAQHQHELRTTIDHDGSGELREVFFDIVHQPMFDAQGQVEGVLTLSVDVTERVRARQQTEALQAEALTAAQQQAQQREAFFHLLADTPAAVALLRGPEHRFEYVNTAYQQLFPDRQLIGRAVAEALPETREAGFLHQLDQVYRTGDTFYGVELPMRLTPADGPARPVYYTFTYQAYRENGQIVGISIFAFDVTEKVQARAQREAERQQLHELFMQAPAPIVILDGPQQVFQLVNPAYQRVFPGRALLGKPVLEALPELRGTPVETIMQQVYHTGEAFVAQEMPLQMARHEGAPLEDLYFTFTFQPRRNAEGVVDGVLMFGHEVTDQVQARRVVEAREASFRLLADHVPGTIWVTNPAGECTYLNARWYATTGQTSPEGLGMGWTAAVHPDDAADAGTTFLAASARREPFTCLFRLRQHNGEYRWVTDLGLPRFDDTGAYEGMVGTVVDVHEQKLAELALQHLTSELGTTNTQLTRTNVDLDNFIYTASHDLKAPISNIEGLLYLLREELPAEVTQQAEIGPVLTRMLDAVERFKRTIDHLTEVSKLQKENAPAADLVNLATVVEDVRQDLQPLLQETGARLGVEVEATPPIHFAEKNLRSIVYNLLSNAIKYRHPDRTPHVDVRAHVRPGHTVLEVHDNGLGIAPAQLPKLFGMFQRFHDHVEGTGIGLYMVKRMVENAGGRIEVHSQLGAGTTFFVFLPHAVVPTA
jgi:PAS domain S-box-containing protein